MLSPAPQLPLRRLVTTIPRRRRSGPPCRAPETDVTWLGASSPTRVRRRVQAVAWGLSCWNRRVWRRRRGLRPGYLGPAPNPIVPGAPLPASRHRPASPQQAAPAWTGALVAAPEGVQALDGTAVAAAVAPEEVQTLGTGTAAAAAAAPGYGLGCPCRRMAAACALPVSSASPVDPCLAAHRPRHCHHRC